VYAQSPVSAPVITLEDERRRTFMVKVYQHIALALAVFVGLEVALFNGGIAEMLFEFFFLGDSGATWLLMLGGVMVVQWFASQAVADLGNVGRQYVGLFAIAASYSVMFAPFLFYVFNYQGTGTVVNAAIITAIGFGVLTAIGLFTATDLSFLRPLVMWGFGIALVAIVGALLFGFNLGTWFSVAMIGLAGAAILWQTQQALRQYPEEAYVAAAAGLFASIMTMFWYVLRLLSSRN
jgi:FtsH-binding integral membrane protein